MKTPTLRHLLQLTILSLAITTTRAANVTWDANTALAGVQDGSGIWDTNSLNWWTGSANAAFVNGVPDVPTFGAGGVAGTVTLGTNITSGNIVFNAPSVGNYTIAGGGYQLILTNRTITPNVGATISADIYGGSLTVPNSTTPAGILTLSGNNSTTNLSLGSSVGNTTAAIRIGSSTALGVASGTIGIAGGQGNQTSHRIELVGNGMTVANSIPTQLGRNNYSAVIVNLGTGNTWSGRLTRSTGGQDSHIASEVANGLTLSGAASGGVALASQATAPRNFVLRGSGGGTISGVISNGSGANNLGLVKVGSGTWTLSGANTFTNLVIVNEGTLNLDYSTQDNSKLPDQGPLTLGGGAVNLSGGTHTEVVAFTPILGGSSVITRSSGAATLRLNALTRNRGGVVNFGAGSIADTDTLNVNGILGGYATVAGADWAMNSTGAGDGGVTAYSGYTDIAASGSSIADGATSNVRLNSAGGGGNITTGVGTTTINTLVQNTATPATIEFPNKTLRLGATGGVLLPATAQSLNIGYIVSGPSFLTAGGADNTPGEIILINNSPNNLTVVSAIVDNGSGITSLTKAGSGSATLAGPGFHTGTNTIAAGTLNISSDANLGAVPGAPTVSQILINGGTLNATEDMTLDANRGIALGPTSRYGNGTISVASGRTLTYGGIIANADGTGNGPGASLTKTGAGTLVLSGANTYSSGTIINGGTLSISAENNLGIFFQNPGCYMLDNIVLNSGTLDIQGSFAMSGFRGILLGPVAGSGTGTISVGDSQTVTVSSRIADNWNGAGSLVKAGNGTLILSGGVNDYSGNTAVSSGIVQVSNSRAIPNGAGKGNVTVNGTLNISGVNVAINGLDGSGFVDNASGTAMTLSVGNNNQSSLFSGSIQNSGGGPLALHKAGNGTLTLANNNFNHNGSTLITAGTLALSGSATIGNTTNIVVSSGVTFNVSGLSGGTLALNSGQTLSGSGTVLGTINAGAGAIAPGTSAGTLSVANVTLSLNSQLNYELANVTTVGGGVNDLLVVSGTLNVAGATTLNLSYLNGIPAASGKYTLIQYGSFAGNVNDISVPPGFTISNNAVSKTIELLVNHTPVNLTWVGDGAANVWDINLTPNWTGGATFFNGDTANFDNTGSSSPAINITVPVSPAAVNVSGSQFYNLTGSSISAATLSKTGTGMLTLENDNSYVTGITIGGGIVQVGNGSTTGTLTGGNITNNGALVFNRSDDVVMNSAISGSGSVTQNGSGSSALTASNSYTGFTFVGLGRLYPRNGAAFGDISGGITVSGGAQIYMDVNVSFPAEPLTLNGLGLASDGALRKGGAGVTAFGGAITLLSTSMINIDGGATLNLTNASGISGNANLTLTGGGGSAGTVSGPVNLGGGAGVLTKTGSGAWTLAGANSMSLATVDDGNLILANNNALGTNLNVVLTSTTGGAGLSGTRLTLSGGLNLPANRTLTMPSGGVGTVRSAFFGTGTGVTNTWAGTVSLTGDSAGSGNQIGFGVDNNSTFVISGNVTSDPTFLGGKLILRGTGGGASSTPNGLGIVTSTLALDPANGQLQVDDGTTWVLSNPANTWLTTIVSGNSTLRSGANNALPITSLLTVGNSAANRLDLAGFNQQVAGMEVATGLAITNSSGTADSTLTYSSGAFSTYGGTISDGTRKLNLTLADNTTLVLTNPATLSLTKSTVTVPSGSVLQLDFTGTNTVNALVLNGVSQAAGLYSSANAAPNLAGTGNLLVVPGPSGPATLTNSVIGNTLSFSWPAGQGWRLQAETNNLSTGVSNNWVYVTDGSVSSFNVTISPGNPTVFFRLRYP